MIVSDLKMTLNAHLISEPLASVRVRLADAVGRHILGWNGDWRQGWWQQGGHQWQQVPVGGWQETSVPVMSHSRHHWCHTAGQCTFHNSITMSHTPVAMWGYWWWWQWWKLSWLVFRRMPRAQSCHSPAAFYYSIQFTFRWWLPCCWWWWWLPWLPWCWWWWSCWSQWEEWGHALTLQVWQAKIFFTTRPPPRLSTPQ